ncbi:MAG: hypothetical protein QOH90_1278, partial [Actinomycetota bacterium]|nr:hypothetical protein [Actinomycetota bacterium]
ALPPAILEESTTLLPLLVLAVGFGVGCAFIVGSDVDPAETVLRGAPLPYWRTLGLRLLGWVVPSVLTLGLLAERASNALGTDPGPYLYLALNQLLLGAAFAIAASRLTGSLPGGGVALALVGAGALVARGWPTLDVMIMRTDPIAVATGFGTWIAPFSLILIAASLWRVQKN